MINECDLVALLTDLPDLGLVRGDVGTVAMVHGQQEGFEVEFVNAGGKTIGVETLRAEQVRKIEDSKAILHVSEETTVERASSDLQQSKSSIVVIDEHTTETSATLPVQPNTITIELPETLIVGQNLTRGDIQLQLAIFLFQQEWYSLGKASEFARLHPAQFQKELANRHIPLHYDSDDYKADIRVLDSGTISSAIHHPAS